MSPYMAPDSRFKCRCQNRHRIIDASVLRPLRQKRVDDEGKDEEDDDEPVGVGVYSFSKVETDDADADDDDDDGK